MGFENGGLGEEQTKKSSQESLTEEEKEMLKKLEEKRRKEGEMNAKQRVKDFEGKDADPKSIKEYLNKKEVK